MKYMGSKSRLANQIAGIINTAGLYYGIDNYYEPFFGSGAVAEKVTIRNKYGSDINKYMVALLVGAQNGTFKAPNSISSDEYNEIKNNKDKYDPALVGFVGSQCYFRGKWFGGYGIEFKQCGLEKNLMGSMFDSKNKRFADINLQHANYLDIDIKPNSIVYCDPPYESTVGYQDKFDHKQFFDWAKEIAKHSLVLISEYEIRQAGFTCIFETSLGGGIANKPNTEKLFIVNNGHMTEHFNQDLDLSLIL